LAVVLSTVMVAVMVDVDGWKGEQTEHGTDVVP
jgi:hypothetical protein